MKTDCTFTSADVGKNLYKKRTYYTLLVEQEVIAKDKDEADQLFLDNSGITYGGLGELVKSGHGVETVTVDADYDHSDTTEYMGKVVYEDEPFAVEDGLVEIDTYADEFKQPEKETV